MSVRPLDNLDVEGNEAGEVLLTHLDLVRKDESGRIVLSRNQARLLASLLLKKADQLEFEKSKKEEAAGRAAAAAIPVDRSARTLADGSMVTEDHSEIDPRTGMQKGYVVLSAAERAKGFVRPVRDSYVHNACGIVTSMGRALAETYARDPKFYSETFCVGCRAHLPVDEFVWAGSDEKVGS